MHSEILRFFLVGLGSNLLNYSTYLLFLEAGTSLMKASIAGYIVGLFCSFYFGRRWVFKALEIENTTAVVPFLFVYLVGGAGMVAIIKILNYCFGWDYRVIWLAGAMFAFVNNYMGSKMLVFRKKGI